MKNGTSGDPKEENRSFGGVKMLIRPLPSNHPNAVRQQAISLFDNHINLVAVTVTPEIELRALPLVERGFDQFGDDTSYVICQSDLQLTLK